MIEQGARAFFPMEKLNVMGLFEPLKRLPYLCYIRYWIIKYFIKNPPDIFIGIDAPDFNLGVEKKLKAHGIKTVHYVSPTIWAWRKNRLKTIQQAVDLMLTIFPFETKIYQEHNIPAKFIGHPFADEISLEMDTASAKEKLGFSAKDTLIAVLPGSRDKELSNLAKPYIEVLKSCHRKRPNLKFAAAFVNQQHRSLFSNLQQQYAPGLPLKLLTQQARLLMQACDCALVTSGTATMEVMLHKKPMVVGYRMSPLGFQIAKRLVNLPYIAMSNLLAEEKLAPEFIQDDFQTEAVARELLDLLDNKTRRDHIIERYEKIHASMRKDASKSAASAVLDLIVG